MSDSIVKHKPTAVFTFGRFQPPTIGHQVLIEGIKTLALERDADPYVFVSSTKNNMERMLSSAAYATYKKSGIFESTPENENPLAVEQKVVVLKKMYPDGVSIINTTLCGCTHLFAIVDKLEEAGYESIVLGVGSDRVADFKRIFKKHGNIEVVGVGAKRRAKNTTASGMSGTKMRMAAARGNLNTFKTGVMIGSMTEANAQRLMGEVRTGLAISQEAKGGRRLTRRMRRFIV